MRNSTRIGATILAPIFLLSACATYGPPGPTMPALIGAGKTQAQFEVDDVRCRQLATSRAGDPASVQQQQIGSAIVGAILGAAFGAAIGGAIDGGSGAGTGAAIGGGSGLAIGAAGGSAQAQHDAARIQRHWDTEYYGCMYAAGHQVPGVGVPAAPRSAPSYAPPPPPPRAPSSPMPPAPCRPTGKYIKTPQGFVEECR